MTDVLVYDKEYRHHESQSEQLCWHSNHRVFADLVPGDRLWVVTSGKALEHEDKSGGYLVAMWPVAQITENPDDDPEYPSRKFGYRVLVNETEAIHLDQPVCVDHVIRGEGYDQGVSIGRFLRGPRRLSDKKVRQLRSAAGADLAQKWLMGKEEGGKMKDEKPQDLKVRTRAFALRVIRLYSALHKSTEAQVLGKQLLRSGTSVGAHYREATRSRSDAEFISKIEGGMQELEETMYWCELLIDAEIMTESRLRPLLDEADELMAILVTCVKKTKSRKQT